MRFQGKVFKLGHSVAVYIPKEVYTILKIGEKYDFEVYTGEIEKSTPLEEKVAELENTYDESKEGAKEERVQSSQLDFCKKHPGSLKITCGCD